MTPRLTAVEVRAALAEALATRTSGTNVEVVDADATHMPFPTAASAPRCRSSFERALHPFAADPSRRHRTPGTTLLALAIAVIVAIAVIALVIVTT
jgi:hypothetical protein